MRMNKFFNMLLQAALSNEPDFLQQLKRKFSESAGAAVNLVEIVDTFSRLAWRLDLCSFKALDPQAAVPPKIRLPSGSFDRLTRDIVEAFDLDIERSPTFPEFMLEFLGRGQQDVVLHVYDVSGGLASSVASWFVGENVDGIWHTGVVVFGREYYYNQNIRYEEPGATRWGEPTKQLWIGSTWYREDEFARFIVRELNPIFTKEAYDVLTYNCNHCSDRLCMWLTGEHVPDDVRDQGEAFMNHHSVKALRPVVNKLSFLCN